MRTEERGGVGRKKMDHDTYSALLGAIAYLSLWVMLLVLWLGRK